MLKINISQLKYSNFRLFLSITFYLQHVYNLFFLDTQTRNSIMNLNKLVNVPNIEALQLFIV